MEYCVEETRQIDHTQVQKDVVVSLVYPQSEQKYPEKLRVIIYTDKDTGETYEYLTNMLETDAITIADLYRKRWEIETLFRWLKQNLKIKQFFGTSQNAVESQIWVALIYYLLVVFIKLQTKTKESLLKLTRKIRVLLFERTSLIAVL